MSEIEIFRRFKIACLERGIDDVDYLVGGAGPGGYMDIISPPSPRGVRAGRYPDARHRRRLRWLLL
jgi:Xaa-Pro dipeptidase